MSQRSHIEVGKWTARHYDLMMDLLLVGCYQVFIERAIKQLCDASISAGLRAAAKGGDVGARR